MLKKSPEGRKTVPQRLKPETKQEAYGTAEAVPLSKTRHSLLLLGVGVVVEAEVGDEVFAHDVA